MAALDDLKVQVERMTTVTDSVVALVQGLAAELEALKGDPVAIQEMVDSLRASAERLAALVQANTPAPPP